MRKNNIQLTDDPLTNIKVMVPMLNDEQRKIMSYVMYGCFMAGQSKGEDHKKEK